jgi:RNA polymerase sigma-70 factor (ECF subfamily)
LEPAIQVLATRPGPPDPQREQEQFALGPTPEEVFRQYAPRIYNLARRLLGNPADAEDVTQDVLLQVLRKRRTFRGAAAFPTWLHRVAVNAALAYRRKRALREGHALPEPPEDFREDGSHRAPIRRWALGPVEAALDHETHELIEKALAQLPERDRDVCVLADLEGLPKAEIAALLGLSVAAVKSRLHRARLLLRGALAPYFEEQAACADERKRGTRQNTNERVPRKFAWAAERPLIGQQPGFLAGIVPPYHDCPSWSGFAHP